MHVVGSDLLKRVIDGTLPVAKLVFNQSGAICFPADQQHRDQQAPSIRYAEDSHGNALAAIVWPGRMEIRGHRAFSDALVADLIRQIAAQSEWAALRNWSISYQGRPLVVAN